MHRSSVQIRLCLLYDFKVGLNASESVNRITSAFGEGTSPFGTLSDGFKKFREGNEELEDMDRGTKPPPFEKEKLIQLVKAILIKHVLIWQSTSSAMNPLCANTFTTWATRKQMDSSCAHAGQQDGALQHLFNFASTSHGVSFWKRIITCDEKWILHDNFRRTSSWTKKVAPKQDLHPNKTLVTVWWNCKGIIHVDYLPPRQSIDADRYCAELDVVQSKLQEAEPSLVNRK
ncbi:transposase, partial [Ostertagia ostertagi]